MTLPLALIYDSREHTASLRRDFIDFYWPKMRKDVKKYVASCVPCQLRKAPNMRKQGFTQPLPITEEAFDTVGIDLITKLPVSYSGYNTIFVCTDNISKYVIAAPMKDEKADTILHLFFNRVIAKFGCPRTVISDRGANIAGTKARDFFRLFGIQRRLTSTYHPQTNGQSERFNRTIAASLTMFIEKKQQNWSDFFEAITFAYSITDHAVTKVSPFELIFNKRPRLPIDNLMERDVFIDPSNLNPCSTLSANLVSIEEAYSSEPASKQKTPRRPPCCIKV